MSVEIKKTFPLSFHWETQDPFIFLAHHRDLYPKGNAKQGPQEALVGRQMGNDFDLSNDYKMYHGYDVPGFPEHPHRGFETVTIVLEGFVDHFDSFGASGRYGNGDVQWMTAGKGMQHCEMFPCVYEDAPNPLELFQVWLNLPKANKFVEPYYKMLWAEEISYRPIRQNDMRVGAFKLISGNLFGQGLKCPAPDSLASNEDANVTIALIDIDGNSEVAIEAAKPGVKRTLYFYEGDQLEIGDQSFSKMTGMMLDHEALVLKAGEKMAKILLLQAMPLNEPIVAYGPFVMNTKDEIRQAYEDYQRTRFGGWPWENSGPVHDRSERRIAKYPDGRVEKP